MRRSALVLAALTAATVAGAAPAGSALAFNGQGSNLDCVPSGPRVIVQNGQLTRVSGGDTLQCPAPINAPGGTFGPHDPRSVNAPPPTPGTPCHFELQSPVPLRFGGGYQGDITNPAGDPPDVTWNDPGYQDLLALPGSNPEQRIDAFFQDAGTSDYYTPWVYDGKWDANGKCVNPGHTWTSPCRIGGTGTFPECLVAQPRVVTGPPPPLGLLGENLPALVNGRFTGGAISSLPEAPANAGLTNLVTCFYVGGMTVDGGPADPNQDVFFAKTVIGGADVDEGRHIVYVFRIHVMYRQTVWDFGDGSPPVTLPPAGADGATTPACANHSVPDQQFSIEHTYVKYSTGGGFPVTVHHFYGVDVDEFWFDSAGSHHVTIPDAVPPVDVPSNPQPFFRMPILQEEGVPVG